jgi:hypothetical protein
MQAARRAQARPVLPGSPVNCCIYGERHGKGDVRCVWHGPRVCGLRRNELQILLRAKRCRALRAGTDHAQLFVAVNPGVVPVGEVNLNRVVPYRRSGLRLRFGFEHRQKRRTRGHRHPRRSGSSFAFGFPSFGLRFFLPRVIACGTRAGIAQVRKVIVARMPVRPGNIHTRAARDVNFYRCRLFSWVTRRGHFYIRGKRFRTRRRWDGRF